MGSGSSKDIQKERGRRSQQHDGRSNRYPARGSKPQNNHYKSHHYNPQRHLVRSAPPIRQIGYDTQALPYRDSRDFRPYPTKSPIPFEDRRSNEPYNISRSMDDMRSRNTSKQEIPIKKRLTASEERLTDLHKQWELGTKFHVVIRVRPMTVREIKESAKDVIFSDEINNECTITIPKPSKSVSAISNPNKSVTFSFDRCYNSNSTTAHIYNELPYSLVESVLEGYNSTIMAYGQTGSGKSFTMQEDPDHIGIIPRAIVHMFEGKERDEDKDTIYTVHVSYVEIYNEEIRDLLNEDQAGKKLDIKGNHGVIAGLTMHNVETVGHCAELLRMGIANRITSATTMNAHSSRSHAIFTVWLKIIHTDHKGVPQVKKAKLNLVDLAGSERHGKTGISTDSGLAFSESKSINLSLSTLGKVIQCLSSDKPAHIPYRESKLTRILQDSLGGNARTLMIACLSPSDTNHEESLSTLKYAHNAKFIKNRPVINDNIDPKDEMIRELQNEIKQLRNKLNN